MEPLVMTVSTVVMALSELRTSVCDDTDTGDIPVYNECSIPDRWRPVKVLPDVNIQVDKGDSGFPGTVASVCVMKPTALTGREFVYAGIFSAG